MTSRRTSRRPRPSLHLLNNVFLFTLPTLWTFLASRWYCFPSDIYPACRPVRGTEQQIPHVLKAQRHADTEGLEHGSVWNAIYMQAIFIAALPVVSQNGDAPVLTTSKTRRQILSVVQVRFMSSACFWAGRAQGTMTNQGSGSVFCIAGRCMTCGVQSPIALMKRDPRSLRMALFRKQEVVGLVHGCSGTVHLILLRISVFLGSKYEE